MQQEDREHRTDDNPAQRPEDGGSQTQQPPLVRLLANPRRVRRA